MSCCSSPTVILWDLATDLGATGRKEPAGSARQPAAHLPHSLTKPSASVSVAHQNRVLNTEEELDLGATCPEENVMMELVDTEELSKGAGALSPKSGTRAMY